MPDPGGVGAAEPPSEPRSERGPAVRTALATLAAMTGAIVLLALGDLRSAAWPAVITMLAWGAVVAGLRPSWPRLGALLLAGGALRLALIGAPPTLSDDVYRYLWEGRVWRAGMNPFVSPPDDPALVGLRDATWALVNHREVSSVYPPAAQLLFVLLAKSGAVGWKIAMGAFDLASAALLFRRRPAAGWLWALLPLPAIETAGSGHLEGAGVCLMLLALAAPAWARPWAALAGGLVKLLPAVMLAPLLRRDAAPWRRIALLALVASLAGLPLLAAGPTLWRGLETYRQIWSFNGSLHPLLALVLSEPSARQAAQALGLLVAGTIVLRSRDPARVALWVTGAFVCLSPTVHPWYVLWPLAMGLWGEVGAWTLLAVLVPTSYSVLATYDPVTSAWQESAWVRLVVYPPFYGALLAEGWRRATRAGPWSVG